MILVLQHEACEPLGIFEDVLKGRGVPYRYCRLFKEEPPEDMDGYTGLVILGGPMNVYQEDEYPFLLEEDNLILEAVQREIPTLGICLGAQLIAKALGARVYKGKKKQIGWYPLRMTGRAGEDPLFSGFPGELKVFQWHGDTFELPDGATLLARDDLYHQAFRYGKAYALQFHLEITKEMIEDWISQYDDEVEDERIDTGKIAADTRRYIEDLNRRGRRLMEGFLRL
ncbi:MAG: type 1 glutamine amidotransferase [Euryarchaeota archaeon]|nr:type 1 glutamine amidotransferase [Euryarchaeota archaeon]